MPLMLASPAIPPGGEMPAQFTCDGADISPPMSWSGVPEGTRSLVLVVGGSRRAIRDFPPLGRIRYPARRTGSRCGIFGKPARRGLA